VLSFHLFPSFRALGNEKSGSSLILDSTQTWWNSRYLNQYDGSLPLNQPAGVIPWFKEQISQYYPGLELAITELNLESESMVESDPLVKALYLADVYGIMAKEGLDYFMQFCINSGDQNTALLDDLDEITALYYPLALFARNFIGVHLEVKNENNRNLSVYASKHTGYLVIMAINKNEQPIKSLLSINGSKKIIFNHTFPAMSITCLRINTQSRGNKAECWEYGREQIN